MVIKQPIDKSHFILPDLGEGVHEAEIISWKVKPGDRVEEHQTLAEMETDKALVEVPSPWPGVIEKLHGKEGEIVAVGSVLVCSDADTGAAAPAPRLEEPKTESEDAGTVVGSVESSLTVSDRFTRRDHQEHVADGSGKALATPAVRRVARELGVDINEIPGTGRGGRVTVGDVHAYTGSETAQPALTPAAPPPPIATDGVAKRIPMRGVRRKIAEALDRSIRTAVHFTLVDEADVTALDAKRLDYATVIGAKLSFLPFIVIAVCRALKEHPSLNANVDDQRQEILLKSVINLGIAVDTDHGLMVAVIPNTDAMSIAQIDGAVADLAKRCRDRSIPREELVGGTFTISNAGSLGGMFSTPIINYPEVAILAVGRAKERVLVNDGKFYAGKVMPLSISCDHRVVDGAECARFLNTLMRLLEQPELLI